MEITDDLSYARTFYPRRSVRVYLNNLAQSVFNSLYKLKKDPFGNFLRFWKLGLPMEMYRARKHLYIAFLVFIVAVLIGVVSTFDDVNFTRVILGDGYVDMTDQFIEEGDPMAVYKQKGELPFFIELFLNNIRVAFLTFAFGLLFCAGTGVFLITNGVMLGTFHTYFYLKEAAIGKGLFLTSLLTVYIHGTFEILAIILSGAAGFVAGMSLLYPGTYTRLQSFQIGMKRGLKIMMGVTPFIFFAAILEGFVTRHTEMSDAAKLSIILISLCIFVFYFVIYPIIVFRKYEKEFGALPEPVYRANRKVELYKLKQVNEIVADAFLIFRDIYSKTAKMIWGIILPLHLLLAYFIFLSNADTLNYHDLNIFFLMDNMIMGDGSPFYFICSALLFSFSIALVIRPLSQYEMEITYQRPLTQIWSYFQRVLMVFPFMLIMQLILKIDVGLGLLLFLALLPFLVYFPVSFNLMNSTKGSRISGAWANTTSQVGTSYGILFISILVLGGIFLLMNSAVWGIIESMVEWHAITRMENYSLFINFIHAAVYFIFLHHFFIFLALLFGLSHYVNTEVRESVSLFRKASNFGKISKTHEKNTNDED